ncbi:3-keto-disaccharide hydrolase [Prosthecobacter dejongeii]|uniref:3-keto-alpha-glucoside-1,2-lyase/3-keto-2-hydroxy-glucal hydratase domain-containing protein n=1 Tax=Prosthecobacter dejongeii TaxID=48465 RepID=A0A7W8DS72_9BACT|nr:DUF1080 domain-containing protein [Prosthecobacter dejongeii]MBB5040010.1 hypothetical protein [Prosthecobacter dejongeii]
MKLLFSVLSLLVVCSLVAQEGAKEVPAKTEWVLFDGKSMANWEAVDMGGSGEVTVEGGQMVINQGESLSGVVYKKVEELPLTNYEITVQAKRLQGVDFFCGLTFPIGDVKKCATLVCGGWGGSVTGISSIDDLNAANNATGTYQRYEDDKWYTIRLRVTPENLSVWVDEKQVVDQDIKGRKVALREGPIDAYAPLSLTTYNTMAAIKSVRFKVIPAAK